MNAPTLSNERLSQYLIYRTPKSREWLCRITARSPERALACAKSMFRLTREAQVRFERVCQIQPWYLTYNPGRNQP